MKRVKSLVIKVIGSAGKWGSLQHHFCEVVACLCLSSYVWTLGNYRHTYHIKIKSTVINIKSSYIRSSISTTIFVQICNNTNHLYSFPKLSCTCTLKSHSVALAPPGCLRLDSPDNQMVVSLTSCSESGSVPPATSYVSSDWQFQLCGGFWTTPLTWQARALPLE